MKNMYAMVYVYLLVIMSTSWVFCSSSNNDAGLEIFMVVDQTTMNDAGIAMMNKANPVQIGEFLLEDGKVLTLSRKSSPSRNYCIDLDQPCGALDWCCEGLTCDGFFNGRCHPVKRCIAQGALCALLTDPCCYPYVCSGPLHGSTCIESV